MLYIKTSIKIDDFFAKSLQECPYSRIMKLMTVNLSYPVFKLEVREILRFLAQKSSFGDKNDKFGHFSIFAGRGPKLRIIRAALVWAKSLRSSDPSRYFTKIEFCARTFVIELNDLAPLHDHHKFTFKFAFQE